MKDQHEQILMRTIRQKKEIIMSNIVYWDVIYGQAPCNKLDTIIDISKSTPQQSNEDNPPNVECNLLKGLIDCTIFICLI